MARKQEIEVPLIGDGAEAANAAALTAVITNAAATPAGSDASADSGPFTRKAYEVLGSINLGRKPGALKPDIRTKGDTLFSDELPADKIRNLLAIGELADTDAPVPPSRAEGFIALGDLLDVAVAAGIVKRDGGSYELGGRTFRGISELRAGVTRDALKSAVIDKVRALVS